jgi:hypothetical protein
VRASAGLAFGLCLIGIGCASAIGGHQALPEAQSACHIEGMTGAQLRVRVIDDKGEALPAIPVVATLVDRATPRPELERTVSAGPDGWAVMDLPGGHRYQILVRSAGFVPRSGVVFLAAGCRTEMSIELTVKGANPIIE